MTLALAYLAGMASMAVVLFLRGASQASESLDPVPPQGEQFDGHGPVAGEHGKTLPSGRDREWGDSPDRRGSTYLDLKLNPKYDKAFRFFTADEMRERFNEEWGDLTDPTPGGRCARRRR